MSGGYVGKILEVDLTSQKIKKMPLDMDEARMFIGGRGLGAKWLWDHTKTGGSYLDPENPLCFMSGPLNGLPAPSTGRLTVVTRSASTFPKSNPETTGICHTNTGGRWAPELKFAGYDAVIVEGKSEQPVYLWIDNDHVSLRDAGHLWGKLTHDTEDALLAGGEKVSRSDRAVRTWFATPVS